MYLKSFIMHKSNNKIYSTNINACMDNDSTPVVNMKGLLVSVTFAVASISPIMVESTSIVIVLLNEPKVCMAFSVTVASAAGT